MIVVKIKSKIPKKACHKKKLKSGNYKNCLEATQLDNKENYLKENKTNIAILKKIIKNS